MNQAIKRASCAMLALLIFLGSFCMFPVLPASAYHSGYWVRIMTKYYGGGETVSDGVTRKVSGKDGSFKYRVDTPDGSWEERYSAYQPGETIYPGTTLSLRCAHEFASDPALQKRYGGDTSFSITFYSTPQGDKEGQVIGGPDGQAFSADPELSSVDDDGSGREDYYIMRIRRGEEHERFSITYCMTCTGVDACYAVYTYEWFDYVSSDDEDSGYWELYDTTKTDSSEWEDGYNLNGWGEKVGDPRYHYAHTVSTSSASFTWKCINASYTTTFGYLIYDEGDTATASASFTPPPAILKGGDALSMQVSCNGQYVRREPEGHPELPDDYEEGASISVLLDYADGGYAFLKTEQEDDVLYTSWEQPSFSKNISAPVGKGRNGALMNIRCDAGFHGASAEWHYYYAYHCGTPPTVDESGNPISGDSGENTNEDYDWYWRYDGTRIIDVDLFSAKKDSDDKYTYESEEYQYRWTWTKVKGGASFHYRCLLNHSDNFDKTQHDKPEDCKKEYADYEMTSKSVKRSYEPGGVITMDMNMAADVSKQFCPQFTVYEKAYLTAINPDSQSPVLDRDGSRELTDEYAEAELYYIGEETQTPKSVSAKFPKKAEKGDYLYVVYYMQADQITYRIGLRYVYTEGTPKGGNVSLSGNTGALLEAIDMDAWKTPGPDGGVPLPLRVLIGVFGVGGTLGAAAVAAGASANPDKDGPRSDFKMYVDKDFGDAIRKGDPLVGVFARIAEVMPDGTEQDRATLSQQIHISSGTLGLDVREVGLMESSMGAEVCVPDVNSKLEEGIVNVCFTGAGGRFTERVKFRIVGEPYVSFPEKPENEMYLQKYFLLGDNQTLEVPVELCNFMEDVSDLELQCSSSDVEVTWKKTTERFRYLVTVRNLTVNDETQVNHEAIKLTVTVTAQNGKESAWDLFEVWICPEGLSVLIDKELLAEEHYRFNFKEIEPVDQNKPEYHPVEFAAQVAYRKPDGSVVMTTDNIKISSHLEGETEAAKTAETKLAYSLFEQAPGKFAFKPKVKLVHHDSDRYFYKIHLSYSGEGGQFTHDMPVWLIGEIVADNRFDVEEEKRRLQHILSIVGLMPNNTAQQLIRDCRGGKVTADKLWLIRREICEEAIEYYSAEAKEFNSLAEAADRQIAFWSTVRWLDNMAFSIVIRAYFGPDKGDYAEAIATPLYNLLLDCIGERASNASWGIPNPPLDATQLVKAALEMGENAAWVCITNGVTDGVFKSGSGQTLNFKQILAKLGILGAVATFMSFMRHYAFDGGNTNEDRFYPALRKAMIDTSINAIKGIFLYCIVGHLWRNSSLLKPMFEKLIGGHLGANGLMKIDALYEKAFKAIGIEGAVNQATAGEFTGRLVEGLCYTLGDGVAEVFKKYCIIDPDGESKLNTKFHITDENGVSHEIDLLVCLILLIDEVWGRIRTILEEFGLSSWFRPPEEQRRVMEQQIPEKQPYLKRKEIEEELGKIGKSPE